MQEGSLCPGPRRRGARRRAGGRAAEEHRIHLPEPQPVQLAHRDRERPDGDGAPRPGGVREMNERAARAARAARAGRRLHHLPAQLSAASGSGWRSPGRWSTRPALVLADEPTAALDAESGQIVLGLLRKLADGMERTTVLIVTHDQRVIDHADRIVNMVGGRIVTNSLTRMAVRITRAGAERGPQGTQRGDPHEDRQHHDRRDAASRARRSSARASTGIVTT